MVPMESGEVKKSGCVGKANKKTKKRVAIKKVIKLLVYLSNLLNRFGKYSKMIFLMPRKSSVKSSY